MIESDAEAAGCKRSTIATRGAHRCARPRAHLHHAAGAAASFRRQLHPFRQRRQDALARLRPGRAVQRQLLHGLHVPDLGPVRPRKPDATGACEFPRQPRLAARHALPGLDLRADADRLLSDLPALSSAGHDRLQLLSFLVAHVHRRAVAVGTGVVPVGAAGVRCDRGAAVVDRAGRDRRARQGDLCAALPAGRCLRRVPDLLGHRLSADAALFRRRRLVRTRTAIRCRSRPAASSSIPAISWSASASARSIFARASSRRMANSRRAGRSGSPSRSFSMARSCSWSTPTTIGSPISMRRRCPGASAYGLAFALFSGAMAFAEPGFFLRFAKTPLRLLDAMRPSAYGIFLTHYIFIIWLQYAVYDPALVALRQIRDRVRRHAGAEAGRR